MYFAFLKNRVPKLILVAHIALAVLYFIIIAFFFKRGNEILFWVLIAGEVFHVWQSITFASTIWETRHHAARSSSYAPAVDIFIPVAGEPIEIIEETVRAATAIQYPDFKIYILNDGYVAGKENWREVEESAKQLGVECITRKTPGGAKAGNINHALRITQSPFVAVLDADHVPKKTFLKKMVPFFVDRKIAYVQSPQFYKNADVNQVTKGAWEQQALFFGPICKGKNRTNSVAMCGTNMVIRRAALEEVGGMCEESIAEDFITGYMLHRRGWKSLYVQTVLAEGLAPEDLGSYFRQQFRWARGGLDLLFRYNLLFGRGLNFGQRIEYLMSVTFFLSGWIVIIDALIPIVYFFTGLAPFQISTMTLASVFLPYIFLMLYTIQRSCNYSFTFRSLAFSLSGFNIHVKATLAALFRTRSGFSVTPKHAEEGNFLSLVIPHLIYIPLVSGGITAAIFREGLSPSVIANMMWALTNLAVFTEFIKGALPAAAPVRTELEALPRIAYARTQNFRGIPSKMRNEEQNI